VNVISMREILGRFHLVGRKERRVLELVTSHFHTVVMTIQRLERLIESAKTGHWELVEGISDEISQLETIADGLHRDAVVAISQGAFFSGTREDFLELMEENDEVADAAQNAARILAESPVDAQSFQLLYEEPKETLTDLFTTLQSCVVLLEESIKSLETDSAVAVSKALLVERAEEEGDEIKNRLIKRIFTHKNDMEVLTLLQLRDFVLKLDEIADAAEDSSDLVISLVAKAEA
jgi:predicted phosphate transport protein (TIGR00153 family)